MKNLIKKDKYYSISIIALSTTLLIFVLYLFGYLLLNDRYPMTPSIPVLEKDRLEKIVNWENSKQDVDTQGRPDIMKFNFGNNEPF